MSLCVNARGGSVNVAASDPSPAKLASISVGHYESASRVLLLYGHIWKRGARLALFEFRRCVVWEGAELRRVVPRIRSKRNFIRCCLGGAIMGGVGLTF